MWLFIEIFFALGKETIGLMFDFPERQVIVPVGSMDEVFYGYVDLGKIHTRASTAGLDPGMVVSLTNYGGWWCSLTSYVFTNNFFFILFNF